MSEWAAKRFWKKAEIVEIDSAFSVELDGRSVRTPAKTALIVPTRELATEIAAEWDAQEEKIDPLTMPFTRSSNAAIDKVRVQHAEVADMLAAYGDSDLICYRAGHPQELIERQNKGWDPLVDWSATELKSPLQVYVGLMHESQPANSIATLSRHVHALPAFQLTAFHDLVSLSGSLIIGFAVIRGFAPASELWEISRIDEQWQIDQWGEDEEAANLANSKRDAFLHADRFFRVSAQTSV
ncbi:MAG: ATP12 family protein [Pseudomonadota bacterium]